MVIGECFGSLTSNNDDESDGDDADDNIDNPTVLPAGSGKTMMMMIRSIGGLMSPK